MINHCDHHQPAFQPLWLITNTNQLPAIQWPQYIEFNPQDGTPTSPACEASKFCGAICTESRDPDGVESQGWTDSDWWWLMLTLE